MSRLAYGRAVAVVSTAMTPVEHALELVTDPAYRSQLERSTADPVEMRAGAIVARLIELGAEDEIAARVLVTEAADRLGGRTGIDHRQTGLQAGGAQTRAEFWLRMPRRALRDA